MYCGIIYGMPGSCTARPNESAGMDEEGGIRCGGSPRQNYGDFHGRKNGREGSFEPVPSDGRQTVEGSFYPLSGTAEEFSPSKSLKFGERPVTLCTCYAGVFSFAPLSPRTKWLIALCLCVLVMLLEFLTYHMAYRIGYDEGMLTTPPVVVQKSDEKAMQNLSRFMADVFASRESLAGILDNREERLAWIRDPELRTETAWGLTRELISRGGVVPALPAARELIDAGYAAGRYQVWAPRADAVAKALLAEHQYTSAYDYLKTAEEGYEKEGMAEPLVRTLQTMSSIDQMLNRNEQANMLLQRAVDAAAHLGPDALPVRSRLLAAQGRLARTTGRIPESREYFKKALALCPQPDKTTGDLALASISMGEAMLEAGRKDEARELFLKGLSGSENATYLLNDCLNALRGLARISTEQGNYEEALAYLYQAEGAARGVLPADHAFWAGLYDQRGGSTSCVRPLRKPGRIF